MTSTQTFSSIRIPIMDEEGAEGDYVEIYPDELPVNEEGAGDDERHLDLINVLRSELAPFRVWRACAVEYHRQGFHNEFHSILSEIVQALENPSVDEIYKYREDYMEGITEIFLALAAKSLSEMAYSKHKNYMMGQNSESAKKVVEYLKLADEKLRINEYTWLIKGFYEIIQGDLKRAEDHFRVLYDRAVKEQKHAKKKFSFGYYVGMGIVAYSRQKYEAAVEMFGRAIMSNPHCDASIRVAFASSCFRLKQYDRAKAALEKALALDATNVDALVLMALLDHVSSNKERNKRVEYRNSAYEYCVLVNAMDPKNASALNLLANHFFHTGRKVQCGYHLWTDSGQAPLSFLVDRQHLLVPRSIAREVSAGDVVILTRQYVIASVTNELPVDLSSFQQRNTEPGTPVLCQISLNRADAAATLQNFALVRLAEPLRSADLQAILTEISRKNVEATQDKTITLKSIEIKHYGKAEKLAKAAIANTSLPPIKAESNFILGKVAHTKRSFTHAMDFYKKALKEAPDMALAQYGLGQILFSQKNFDAAIEMFDKVLKSFPEDKDTQAFSMLVRAMQHNEEANFDRLREVAPGFQFEIDLWMIQGSLRQKRSNDHLMALKCYIYAKDCIETKGLVLPSTLLSNIAVLYHAIGKMEKALKFSKMTLSAFGSKKIADATDASMRTVFKSADLEDVFYCWSDTSKAVLVTAGAEEDQFVQVLSADSGGGDGATGQERERERVEWTTQLTAGDEVLIEDIKHVVESVCKDSFICRSPVKLSYVFTDKKEFSLRLKNSFDNFCDETVTYSYNLARILEDSGFSKSASELYVELLKMHPSFIECYLRLSIIACASAKYDDATGWLSRALAVNDGDTDVNICLADLYDRRNLNNDAKKIYHKIILKEKTHSIRDSRSRTSLGNFHYSQYCKAENAEDKEKSLYEAGKFYLSLLNDDNRFVYAANGMGILFAEMGHVDEAKAVIAKAQEAGMPLTGDINSNLGHVFLVQNRFLDAERLYQLTIRNLPTSSKTASGENAPSLLECAAFAQYKQDNRDEDASQSMLKAIHLQPSNLQYWYNAALISKHYAENSMVKPNRVAGDIVTAISHLTFAKSLFGALGKKAKKHATVDRKKSELFEKECSDKEPGYDVQLSRAVEENQRQAKIKEELDKKHQVLRMEKVEKEHKLAEQLDLGKKEKQAAALLKNQKLEELKEQWSSVAITAPREKAAKDPNAPRGAKKAKKEKKAKKMNSDDELDDNFYNDNDSDQSDADGRKGGKLPDDIFGSDSETEKAGGKPKSRLDADIFGDSDDEQDDIRAGFGASSQKRKQPSQSDADKQEPAQKRLKPSSGNSGKADSDDELAEEGERGPSSSAATKSATKSKSRVILDDSDED